MYMQESCAFADIPLQTLAVPLVPGTGRDTFDRQDEPVRDKKFFYHMQQQAWQNRCQPHNLKISPNSKNCYFFCYQLRLAIVDVISLVNLCAPINTPYYSQALGIFCI